MPDNKRLNSTTNVTSEYLIVQEYKTVWSNNSIIKLYFR